MDRRNPYHHHRHHHQQHQFHQQQLQTQLHQQQQHLQPPPLQNTPVDPGGGVDRFPQWSAHETKELLMIREELDQAFMETKRNKLLWEVVASKMNEKGFARSADQCKSKWKNLVTRFKGCEAVEPEAVRQQFPFYNEIQSILASRMQRMLWADQGGAGPSGSRRKRGSAHLSSDDDEDDDDEDQDQEIVMKDELLVSQADTHQKGSPSLVTSNPTKKSKKGKAVAAATGTPSSSGGSIKEVVEEFMRQMGQMEREWRETYEARERERERKEREWKKRMEELEKERLAIERRWIEREEERRVRDEARAQKRDALIDALLNKLTRDQGS